MVCGVADDQHSADLVPVFSFVSESWCRWNASYIFAQGENDIYQQLSTEDGSNIHKLQKTFQKIFGFTLPLFHGRGIFNCGLLSMFWLSVSPLYPR